MQSAVTFWWDNQAYLHNLPSNSGVKDNVKVYFIELNDVLQYLKYTK